MDLKPTKAMMDAAQKALDERAKKPPSERGGTPVGIARARDIINGKELSEDTWKRMLSFFQRHEVDKEGQTWGTWGKGRQAWGLWGGDPGFARAKKVVNWIESRKTASLKSEIVRIAFSFPETRIHLLPLITASFRLSAKDKKVIEAFTVREALEGRLLSSDGKSLRKYGMGGEKVAVWRGPKIAILSSESAKSDETIINYIVRVAGKRMVTFSYQRGGHDIAIRFETFSDAVDRYQTRTAIVAMAPNGDKMGRLIYDYYPYDDGKGNYAIVIVEVDPEYRRANVATEMYREMFRREKITKRDLREGLRTEDGAGFRGRALLASDKDVTNDGKDPLKCMPRNKAHDTSKKDRAELAITKQRAEKADTNRGKSPTRTPTFE